MTADAPVPALVLAPGEVYALDDAPGARICATGGTVWITEEGEIRDVVLRPGERHTVARPGRTLVHAMERSRVSICIGAILKAVSPPQPEPRLSPIDEYLCDVRFRMHSRL